MKSFGLWLNRSWLNRLWFNRSFNRRSPARTAAGCATVLVLLWGAAGTLLGQDGNTPAPQPKNGLQIRSVSAYGVYYSSFLPNGGSGAPAGSTNLPPDLGAGGSFEFAW